MFPCNSVLNGPQPQLQQGSVPPDWRLETYYRKFITYDCGRSPRAATQRALPSDRFNIAICHRACTRWRRCFRSASLFGSWPGLTSVDTRVQDPACGTSCSGRTLGRGSTAASWMLIEPCCRALALLIVRCSHRHSYRQRRQPSELVEDDVEAQSPRVFTRFMCREVHLEVPTHPLTAFGAFELISSCHRRLTIMFLYAERVCSLRPKAALIALISTHFTHTLEPISIGS